MSSQAKGPSTKDRSIDREALIKFRFKIFFSSIPDSHVRGLGFEVFHSEGEAQLANERFDVITAVESDYRLNEAMTKSNSRRALKHAVNGLLILPGSVIH